jgi:hypothetical protein
MLMIWMKLIEVGEDSGFSCLTFVSSFLPTRNNAAVFGD